MQVIGLTGGIGSGKSTIAEMFAKYGVPIIDADQIARRLVEPGQPALKSIVHTFGNEILTQSGSLDRRLLRERIFSDPEQRKRLESILHPLIMSSMLNQLDTLDTPYAILVIPLLVDTGNWEMIDRILVVDTEERLQVERVVERDGVSAKQAAAIIDNQVSRQDRLAAADDVIENTGNIEDLENQVKRLHEFYLNLARDEDSDDNPVPILRHEPNSGHLIYEQPLNERTRTFLRLEYLFNRASYHLGSNTKQDAHAFINTLVEINSLINRGDLKGEVIKELERQNQAIKRHSDTPSVDQNRLNTLLEKQDKRMTELVHITEQLGQHLKNDILFSTIQQRLNIPGATCEFDLPMYSHWLNLPPAQRASSMQAWFAPFKPVANAIALCLETLRNVSGFETKLAIGGYYEQSLNAGSKAQLVRVSVEHAQPYYPAISAGKHRFSIRFMEYIPGEPRSPQVQDDITFGLTICSI